MFVCQICGGVVPPRTPAIRIVTSRRHKQYPFRSRANLLYRPDSSGKVKEYFTDDPGGTGWEIAREILSCPRCADSTQELDQKAGAPPL